MAVRSNRRQIGDLNIVISSGRGSNELLAGHPRRMRSGRLSHPPPSSYCSRLSREIEADISRRILLLGTALAVLLRIRWLDNPVALHFLHKLAAGLGSEVLVGGELAVMVGLAIWLLIQKDFAALW